MFKNLYRTVGQIESYAETKPYPKFIAVYAITSLIIGGVLAHHTTLPTEVFLAPVVVLFVVPCFTLSVLGVQHDTFISDDDDSRREEIVEEFYLKTFHISIHTIGIGFLLVLSTTAHTITPTVMVYSVNVIEAFTYSVGVWFFRTLSTTVTNTFELMLININEIRG